MKLASNSSNSSFKTPAIILQKKKEALLNNKNRSFMNTNVFLDKIQKTQNKLKKEKE